jgi:hypothetical protein
MISIEIGELVLRGFASVDAQRVAQEAASALAAKLGGEVVEEPRQGVGNQIAQAVYEAIRNA